jgi:hypothetical protein
VVVGGEAGARYDRIGPVSLAPGNASLAYVANDRNRETVVVPGRWSFVFANVHALVWAPDGRELVVLGRQVECDRRPAGRSCWCLSRGRDCVPEDDLFPATPAVSPDGRVATVRQRALREDGYEPTRDDRFWVSFGSLRGPELLDVTVGPVLDGSGRHVGYAGATRAGVRQVFRDGQPVGEPMAQVNDLVLSSDGAHVAWTGGGPGSFRAFVDGRAGRAHDWARDAALDPGGTRVAYAARDAPRGPWRIVAGTVEGPACDWVGRPHWSPDGKHVAYAARVGREVWWKVLDVR